MFSPALQSVFANAAVPQKCVLIVLLAAIPAIVVAALLALRGGVKARVWGLVISYLGAAGLTLGLLVGGLNSFHMGETIKRLPVEPTLKQLAPGIFEVSTLVGLGALVGVLAVVAHAAIGLFAAKQRTSANAA